MRSVLLDVVGKLHSDYVVDVFNVYYKLGNFFSQLQVVIVAESMVAVRKAAVIFKLYVAFLVTVSVASGSK